MPSSPQGLCLVRKRDVVSFDRGGVVRWRVAQFVSIAAVLNLKKFLAGSSALNMQC